MRIEDAFGEQLRKYRLDRKLTQADLALRSGVTTRYLRNLEQGLSSPTLAVIVKIAASLEVEAHELVKNAVDLMN